MKTKSERASKFGLLIKIFFFTNYYQNAIKKNSTSQINFQLNAFLFIKDIFKALIWSKVKVVLNPLRQDLKSLV